MKTAFILAALVVSSLPSFAFAGTEVVCEAATIVTNPGGDGSTQTQGKKVVIKSLASSAAALSPAAALNQSRQIVTKGFMYSKNCAALEY